MATGTKFSQCNPNKCKIKCCKNDFECADNVWECRIQEIGSICFESHECKSSCCDSKVCNDPSECSFSEFKAISFIAILVLSSLIFIIFCVYCRYKRKNRYEHPRRGRVSRLRDVIAEGEIVEDEQHGPPINMIAITMGRSISDLSNQSNQSDDLQRINLTKLDPIGALEDNSEVVWRRRTSTKVLHPIRNARSECLDEFDPYVNTRSSTRRHPVEEGVEARPSSIFELHLHNCDENDCSEERDKK